MVTVLGTWFGTLKFQIPLVTESVQLALRRQLHLLRCGSSRAAHRIRWICNTMTKKLSQPRASRERITVS
jgi:hypothetical protein